MTATRPGTLWVVATPIGNLDDLAPRAVAVLRAVAAIACEDTRHSGTLLARFDIRTPTLAMHDHNEREIADSLVQRLLAGESLALISDAGTPLLSDPGYRLVGAARRAGIRVSPVPGPSALVAALSVAGLPTDRFAFEGFLPAKTSARRERLTELATETRTLVFYEARHRILETLDDAVVAFGPERRAVIARELTKVYETVLDGPLGELREHVAADEQQRLGEIVLLVAGAPPAGDAATTLREGERVFRLLMKELPAGKAAKLAAAITGAPRNALYHLVEPQ